MYDFSPEVLAAVAFGAVMLHVIWVLLSNRYPSIYVLAAAFMLLSPFSLSPLISGVGAFKLGRIYVTILMAISAFVFLRRTGLGPATKLFLFFIVYFFLGVIWSDHPLQGFNYKGLFVMLALGGLTMGACLRTMDDFHRGM